MAYRSSSAGATGSQATNVPTGAAIGDVMIACLSSDQVNDTHGAGTSGFTQIGTSQSQAGPDGQTSSLWYKILAAADTGTYTFSIAGGGDQVACACFSGRANTAPTASSPNVNTTANASPVSIDATGLTAVAGDDLVHIFGFDPTGTPAGTLTAPSGYTMRQYGDSIFSGVGLSTKDNSSAGATGTVSASDSITGTAGYTAWLVRIPALVTATRIPQITNSGYF